MTCVVRVSAENEAGRSDVPAESTVAIRTPAKAPAASTYAISLIGHRTWVLTTLDSAFLAHFFNVCLHFLTELAAPGAPSDLQVVTDGCDVTLTWQAPAQDGGSPITQYLVVYRETSKQKFKKCGKTKPEATHFTITSSLKAGAFARFGFTRSSLIFLEKRYICYPRSGSRPHW